MTAPIVTFTTDFGLRDSYVAAMKGVVLGICPEARLVDISHEIEPQDVLHGALVLRDAAPWFPDGTIHVVVVDPGVGTRRLPLAVTAGAQVLVGPDNGVLLPAARRLGDPVRAWSIDAQRYGLPERSNTFHGRDVFAPAAAHIAAGVVPSTMGNPVSAPVSLDIAEPTRDGDTLRGTILRVDHFGNLVTNITRDDLQGLTPQLLPGAQLVIRGVATTYGDVAPGEPLLLVGSSGNLEIAVNQGSAADLLGWTSGAPCILKLG